MATNKSKENRITETRTTTGGRLYLNELADDLLDKYRSTGLDKAKIPGADKEKIMRWIFDRSFDITENNLDKWAGKCNPLLPAGVELVIPADGVSIKAIMAELIEKKELEEIKKADSENALLIKEIKQLSDQERTSCFNYVNGCKYNFQIEVIHAENAEYRFFPVMTGTDGKLKEFGKREFVIFTSGSLEESSDSIFLKEKTKTFEEAGIVLKKIAADNNHLFCYGIEYDSRAKAPKMKNGCPVHHFFWMQLEYTFIDEPGLAGKKIPGLYYRKETGNEKQREENLKKLNSHFNNHPSFSISMTTLLIPGWLRDLMPVVVQPGVWYEISPECLKTPVKEVLDIGVKSMHRYENYKSDNGGEVQAWISPQTLEDFWSLQNIAGGLSPNLSFHDGMGFNDGTTNFFILANNGTDENPDCTLLWIDEQEGPSEKWRRLDFTDRDFSSPLKKFFIFNQQEKYLKSFRTDFKKFDTNSRMAVSRYPVMVTGKNTIHSVSFHWGTCDYAWTTRPYPAGEIVFPQTLRIRDDNTVCMPGLYNNNGTYEQGYWYQKYLPQSILQDHFFKTEYSAKIFNHEWRFVKEEVFKIMDEYCTFGIYDAYDTGKAGGFISFRDIEDYYSYRGVDDRCQYYILKPEYPSSDSLEKNFFETDIPAAIDRIYHKDPQKAKEKKELLKTQYELKYNEYKLKYQYRYPPADILNPVLHNLLAGNPNAWEAYDRKQELINPVFGDYKTAESLKISLRYDSCNEQWIAVYTHPRDSDIYADLNKKINGLWRNTKNTRLIFKFECLPDRSDSGHESQYRIRDFSPPAVEEATLELVNKSVKVSITSNDKNIRYVTVGAVLGNKARRISARYCIGKNEMDKWVKSGNKKIDIYIKLLPGIEKAETLFTETAHRNYGTSVWFEDILGHKSTPEKLIIR